MRKEYYVEILKQQLKTSGRKLKFGAKGSSIWPMTLIPMIPPN